MRVFVLIMFGFTIGFTVSFLLARLRDDDM